MLAAIETCTVIFLKESVTLSAYEGARIGIHKNATDAQVSSRIQEFLDSRGIEYEDNFLTFSNPSFDDADALENVTVTVTVPCEGNTYTGWMFTGRSVEASVTMRKEFANDQN